MGRITIFTDIDEPACTHVKQVMDHFEIPYTEISISTFPERRKDMLSLTDRMSVPQIFLNNTLLSGSDNLIQILDQWEKDRGAREMYNIVVGQAQDPQDPRMQQPPTANGQASLQDREETIRSDFQDNNQDLILLPKDGGRVSVLEMTEILRSLLPRQDLTYRLKVYENSFRASDAVTALAKKFELSTEEAVKFGQMLQSEHHLLDHVVSDHVFSNTDSLFFRLQCDQTPTILNSYRIWSRPTHSDPMVLMKNLSKLLEKIENDVSNKNNNQKIDYKKAKTHELFPTLQEAVCELQGVNYNSMCHNTKLAFSINLYNFMIRYAYIKHGISSPKDSRARHAFFNKLQIWLGDDLKVSFHDLEQAASRRGPCTTSLPTAVSSEDGSSSSSEPESEQSSDSKVDDQHGRTKKSYHESIDPRVYFAFTRCTNSCPEPFQYTSTDIEEELRVVALTFCSNDKNVHLDDATMTLRLSTIFKWHHEDFVSQQQSSSATATTTDLPSILLQYLPWDKRQRLQTMIRISTANSKGIKLEYNEYDWTPRFASDYVSFQGNLDPNHYRRHKKKK